MTKNIDALPFSASVALSVQGRDVPLSRQLEGFAHRRLSSSLGRFSKRIQAITVWLEDINGPRGGADKLCRMQVQLQPKGRLIVSAVAANEFLALSRAATKARTILDRALKQRRTKQRRAAKAFPTHMSLNERPESMSLISEHDLINRIEDSSGIQTVGIGTTVAFSDLHSGELEEYVLVQPADADILRNRISSFTPAGRALYGRKVGDTVKIVGPGGPVHVRIERLGMEQEE